METMNFNYPGYTIAAQTPIIVLPTCKGIIVIPVHQIIRIHRTHFVNINYIKSYSGSKSGLLYLHNGEIFSVARRKKANLTKRLNSLNNSFADEPSCTSSLITKKNIAA